MKSNTTSRGTGDNAERGSGRLSARLRIAEIEAAARQELAEKGYQNFQPSEVARRCGVSEATIYRYFPSKRDLLIKVAEDWTEEMLSIEPEIAREGDIFSRLRHVIRHSLWVIHSEPALSRFVLQELRPDPTYRLARIYDLNRRFTANVMSLVEEGIAAGKIRPGVSPGLVRNLIYGGIEHETWSYLRDEGDFDLDAAADGIANVIFHGLSTTPIADVQMLAPVVWKMEIDVDSLRSEIRRLASLLSSVGGDTKS